MQTIVLKWWLASSQDPTVVSNKIRGVVLMFSGVIILVLSQVTGVHLTSNDMITFSSEVGAVGGLMWALFGAIMHLLMWLGSKKVVTDTAVPTVQASMVE